MYTSGRIGVWARAGTQKGSVLCSRRSFHLPTQDAVFTCLRFRSSTQEFPDSANATPSTVGVRMTYQPVSPVSGPVSPGTSASVGRSGYPMPGMGSNSVGAGAVGGGTVPRRNGAPPGNRPPLANGFGAPMSSNVTKTPINGVNIMASAGFQGSRKFPANGQQRPPPFHGGGNNAGHTQNNPSRSMNTSPPQNYGNSNQSSYGRSPPGPQGMTGYRPPSGIRLDRPVSGVGGGQRPGMPQTMPSRRRIPPPPAGRSANGAGAGHQQRHMPGAAGRHSFNGGHVAPPGGGSGGHRQVPVASQTMRTLPTGGIGFGIGGQPKAPSKILPTPQQTELMVDYLLEKLSVRFKGKKKEAVRQFEWWFFEREHAPFSEDQVKVNLYGFGSCTRGII